MHGKITFDRVGLSESREGDKGDLDGGDIEGIVKVDDKRWAACAGKAEPDGANKRHSGFPNPVDDHPRGSGSCVDEQVTPTTEVFARPGVQENAPPRDGGGRVVTGRVDGIGLRVASENSRREVLCLG